jgi:hypothetical protein
MYWLKRTLLFVVRYFYALFSSIYLFVIGFMFPKNRLLVNQISAHFGLPVVRPGIGQVKLSKLLEAQPPVQLIEAEGEDGNVRLSELVALSLFARAFQPRAIFEIGTFDGRTTMNLALNSPADAKVYTLDLPKDCVSSTVLPTCRGDQAYLNINVTGARYRSKDERSFPEKRKIVQLYGDSATFDFSPYFNGMDLAFVDGAHSYDYVRNDSRIALKMLRGGKGVILWHDYGIWGGVTKALNELQARNPQFHLHRIQDTTLICLILR